MAHRHLLLSDECSSDSLDVPVSLFHVDFESALVQELILRRILSRFLPPLDEHGIVDVTIPNVLGIDHETVLPPYRMLREQRMIFHHQRSERTDVLHDLHSVGFGSWRHLKITISFRQGCDRSKER